LAQDLKKLGSFAKKSPIKEGDVGAGRGEPSSVQFNFSNLWAERKKGSAISNALGLFAQCKVSCGSAMGAFSSPQKPGGMAF
jgi:hypothetical protein